MKGYRKYINVLAIVVLTLSMLVIPVGVNAEETYKDTDGITYETPPLELREHIIRDTATDELHIERDYETNEIIYTDRNTLGSELANVIVYVYEDGKYKLLTNSAFDGHGSTKIDVGYEHYMKDGTEFLFITRYYEANHMSTKEAGLREIEMRHKNGMKMIPTEETVKRVILGNEITYTNPTTKEEEVRLAEILDPDEKALDHYKNIDRKKLNKEILYGLDNVTYLMNDTELEGKKIEDEDRNIFDKVLGGVQNVFLTVYKNVEGLIKGTDGQYATFNSEKEVIKDGKKEKKTEEDEEELEEEELAEEGEDGKKAKLKGLTHFKETDEGAMKKIFSAFPKELKEQGYGNNFTGELEKRWVEEYRKVSGTDVVDGELIYLRDVGYLEGATIEKNFYREYYLDKAERVKPPHSYNIMFSIGIIVLYSIIAILVKLSNKKSRSLNYRK